MIRSGLMVATISIHLMLRFIYGIYCIPFRLAIISIHLMLRFIKIFPIPSSLHHIFQYISCYGLSVDLKTEDEINANFNTSHVTVYLEKYPFLLSRRRNFNTSHVTVYQDAMYAICMKILDFNTSHVTVYHCRKCNDCNCRWISIHLMLRFIDHFHLLNLNLTIFQYISCYGLSESQCFQRKS